VSKRTWGILAGIAGSALSTWYFRSRRAGRAARNDVRDHGTVIYDNTPVASDSIV
jgi:hypothetical protein